MRISDWSSDVCSSDLSRNWLMALPEIPGQELRSAGGREQSAPGLSHDAATPLIGIRRTLSSGLSERGTVTVRTTFLNVALALSCSTPYGRLIRRSKLPLLR